MAAAVKLKRQLKHQAARVSASRRRPRRAYAHRWRLGTAQAPPTGATSSPPADLAPFVFPVAPVRLLLLPLLPRTRVVALGREVQVVGGERLPALSERCSVPGRALLARGPTQQPRHQPSTPSSATRTVHCQPAQPRPFVPSPTSVPSSNTQRRVPVSGTSPSASPAAQTEHKAGGRRRRVDTQLFGRQLRMRGSSTSVLFGGGRAGGRAGGQAGR